MGTVVNRKSLHKICVIVLWPLLLGAKGISISQKEKSVLNDIQAVQSILNDNAHVANNVAGEIAHLEYQVMAARKIIYLIDDQVNVSNAELGKLQDQLNILEDEQRQALAQFQSILLEEYKNRDYKRKLYFLASSKNISEFVNRLNHLNTLKDFRMKHLIAIDNKKKEVMDKLAVYSGSKAEKNQIAESKTVYITQLNQVLREKHQRYKQIESENQSLQLRLKEQNDYLSKLNKEVENVVEVVSKNNAILAMSDLSWPVNSGLIVGKFGVNRHQKERKVNIANNGIDILVALNEAVNCAASGEVKAIMELPGQNFSVIIDHGSFYSVYSNVFNVLFKVGEPIDKGDKLANVARNQNNMCKLHLEFWKGTTKVDPEKYLSGSL